MIVLVHGAWHGGWCWAELERSLQDLGVPSRAVDLPGHGGDHTRLADLTLDLYTEAVLSVLAEIDEPVLLVGHSLGGVTISQVAERAPERLMGLVYLAAVLVTDGNSIVDAMSASVGGIADSVEFSEDLSSMSVDPAAAADLLYADCEPAAIDAAIARLQPEPFLIASTPLHVTTTGWGAVPRTYIVCTPVSYTHLTLPTNREV